MSLTIFQDEEKKGRDIPVGISYNGDADKAVEVAMEFMKSHEDVLDKPEPQVSGTAWETPR